MERTAKWLDIVAKDHKKWVKIVQNMGEYDYAEDIVQQAYLALYKYTTPEKVVNDGKVSEGYMFFTLKTMYMQFLNAKNKVKKLSIDEDHFFWQLKDVDTIEENEAFHKICKLIDEEMQTWAWYNRKLTELYRDTDLSIRKIAAKTNISFVSIFNTLKKCKIEIKNKLQDQYENYKSENYERIRSPKNG